MLPRAPHPTRHTSRSDCLRLPGRSHPLCALWAPGQLAKRARDATPRTPREARCARTPSAGTRGGRAAARTRGSVPRGQSRPRAAAGPPQAVRSPRLGRTSEPSSHGPFQKKGCRKGHDSTGDRPTAGKGGGTSAAERGQDGDAIPDQHAGNARRGDCDVPVSACARRARVCRTPPAHPACARRPSPGSTGGVRGCRAGTRSTTATCCSSSPPSISLPCRRLATRATVCAPPPPPCPSRARARARPAVLTVSARVFAEDRLRSLEDPAQFMVDLLKDKIDKRDNVRALLLCRDACKALGMPVLHARCCSHAFAR